MIEGMISNFAFMQFFSLYDLYYTWESNGVYDFLLPMLLIFAVVFGILTSTKILGESRGINFIISITLALLAMRLGLITGFFAVIFQGLGVGIAILIVLLILAGLFLGDANLRVWLPTFFWGGLIIGLIVVISVLNEYAWFGSYWWQENWNSVIVWVIIIAIGWFFLRPKKTSQERQAEEIGYVLPMPWGRAEGSGRRTSG
jgi:hypothetical protein